MGWKIITPFDALAFINRHKICTAMHRSDSFTQSDQAPSAAALRACRICTALFGMSMSKLVSNGLIH